MAEAVLGVMATVLLTIVAGVIAWVKWSMKGQSKRITALEADVKKCHQERMVDAEERGKMQTQISHDAKLIAELKTKVAHLEARLEKYELENGGE